MTINLSAYKGLYLETARKLVEEYVSVISAPETEKTVPDLVRIFHSIKGQSMAMGYKNIAELALEIEKLCRTLGENKSPLTPALRGLLPTPKALHDELDSIEKTNTDFPIREETGETNKLVEEVKNKPLEVLVVEDDLFFQKICIDKLKERFIHVDFSSDGEDAIARMAVKEYDCILLDIIMPKKNGFDVLEYAKNNNIIPKTPIIVFSTLGQEESVQKTLMMGAVDFINKGDFDFDSLLSKIKTVINKG